MKTEQLENEIQNNKQTIESIKNENPKVILGKLIEKKGFTIHQMSKKSGFNNYLYEMTDGTSDKKISRAKILKLLIILETDIETINKILQKFSYSKIYVKVKSDAIIYLGIINKNTLEQINEALHSHNFDILE